MKIFKYQIPVPGQPIAINAPILSVLAAKNLRGNICVWCEVEERDPEEEEWVYLMAVGTGWPLPDDFLETWTYIDTVIDDEYVWHVYASGVEVIDEDDMDELLC